MSFIAPLLYTLCLSGVIILVSKKRFEQVVPLALMSSALFVYLFGLFGNLFLGYYLSLAVAVSFPILVVILVIKRKDLSQLVGNFLTPGFCIFLVIYVFIYILNLNRGLTMWDEFSHWAASVKEMLRLHDFYSVAASQISGHKDYPPIIGIFQLIWCRLAGGYKEAYLYRSLQTLSLSLFLPMFSKFTWKKSWKFYLKLVLLMFVAVVIPVFTPLGRQYFYQSIYVDCIMGFLLAYCLSLVVIERRNSLFKYVSISIALSFMLLVKQIGIAFCLLVFGAFIVNTIIINKEKISSWSLGSLRKIKLLSVLFPMIFLIIVPSAFLVSWNAHIAPLHLPRQFDVSAISLTKLQGIMDGTSGLAYQHVASVNFMHAVLTQTMFTIPVPRVSWSITLAYWQFVLMGAVVFILIGVFGKKIFIKFQVMGLTIMLLLGAAGYAFVMLLTYVFCFGDYEGPTLASYDRYMGTYLLAMVILAVMLYIFTEGSREEMKEKSSLVPVLVLAVPIICALLLFQKVNANFVPQIKYHSSSAPYAKDAELIRKHTTRGTKVFIISQRDNGRAEYIIQYLILPEKCNYSGYSLGKPYFSGDVWTKDWTPQALIGALVDGDYTYLYLRHVDQQFILKYRGIFKLNSEIKDKQLYKIVKTQKNAVRLDPIE
ncbi:MAG: hypothetical protein JJE36_06450 [Coriobacteriia bacterium]|nr:hypothetical protein [Coriobacteriia bacterium]